MTKVVKRSLLFVMTVVLALCAFMTVGAMSAKADSTVITPIGASIRLNEGSTGIRFEASISQEVEGAVYGFIIVPDYYLDGIDGDYGPELSQKYSGNIIVLQSTPVDGVIKGSVANIKPQNYGLTYAGIPFEGFPETDNFIYGEIMYASILDVASAAKIDTEANYEVEELAIIDDFYAKGKAEEKEDYVASFDFAGYVANAFDFAETQSDGVADYGIYPGSGVVVDYAGTENVGKYYFYTGSQYGYHTDNYVKIALPQSYGTDGYTIRYAIDYNEGWAGGNFMFTSGGAGSTEYLRLTGDTFPVDGEWMETYVNTNGATDNAIYLRFHKGAAGSQVINLYIDYVKAGDTREFTIELEDGYLAQYDSELYNNLAATIPVRDDASSLGDQGVSSALLASYTDASDVTETDVLKLTVSGGHQNTVHTSVIVKVDLPKAHTTAGYTIRWAMNCTALSGADASAFITGGGTVRFITDEYVNNTNAWLDKFVIMNSDVYTQNTWATTYVGTLGTESNSLYIMIHRGQVTFGTFEFYISWVKEGDQLPWGTEEGEIASFNSDKYLTGITLPFAGTSNGKGQSLVSAEILESVELGGVTESSVLKVVVQSGTDANDLGHVTAGVKIPLAEKYTAAGYTVRWAINFPSLENGNVRFFESAYANGGAWVDANNIYIYGNTLANDTWYTTYVGCTNESLSEIYMMAHGGFLGAQNITFYFAWVKEGDQVPNPMDDLTAKL